MPSGRRTSEPVRMGVATNRPNSVSLRLSSALILIPMTENITQTAKFTAKASVLAASAETCSRLYSTLFTVDVVTSVLPWSCARRTASAPFNPHCAASHLPSSIERGPASRDSGRAQRRRGVGRPGPQGCCARQLRECLPLAHGALLLDERCGGALEIDALDRRRTGEELQILAQCRDEALLAQRLRDGAPNGFERRRHARLARLHLDHVQAEAAVHEPRQHADLGLAEDLARELRRAVVRGQRAQITTFRPAGTIGQRARRVGEAVARLAVVATHVEQRCLGAFAQRDDVRAR